ncbi:MAG TPA: hypothetical protein VGM44_03480 [Polyangiaceae bacterium]|jgi:hypothetical protein
MPENQVSAFGPDTEEARPAKLEHLTDGNLASAAWSGYRRLPSDGLYEIIERVTDGVHSVHSEPSRAISIDAKRARVLPFT